MKNNQEQRHHAEASFYLHLVLFVLANSLLVGINLTSSPSVLWFLFVLLGWGSGLFIHGLVAFWPDPELEERITAHN